MYTTYIIDPMLTLLSLRSSETVYSCLEHIIVLMNSSHQLLLEDYKYFYRKYDNYDDN